MDYSSKFRSIKGMWSERFFKYVNVIEDKDSCWEWTGGKAAHGYGAFSYKGRQVGAHRWSLKFLKGVDPGTLLACHHCDNKSCVRPSHLYAATHKQNVQDAIERGLWDPTAQNGLSDDEVLAIRNSTETYGDLAKEYGLHWNTISSISRGKTYKHIGGPLKPTVGLSDDVVFAIRKSRASLKEIAKEHGISLQSVRNARWGRTHYSVGGAIRPPRPKLKAPEVLEIYNSKSTMVAIAEERGMSYLSIWNIKNGKAWASITGHAKKV